MNGCILLLVISCIYYCVWRYYPDIFQRKHHIYMGIFVSLYMIIYYLLCFEPAFSHKILHNVYTSSQEPLYTTHSQTHNSNLYSQQNPHADIKEVLLVKQGSRCLRCQNYILGTSDMNLTYVTALQSGGSNEISNVGLVCASCSVFNV
jgi:hypothetical protein